MFKRKKWKYLILDEAHMIKNWKSQRWQARAPAGSPAIPACARMRHRRTQHRCRGEPRCACCRPRHALFLLTVIPPLQGSHR